MTARVALCTPPVARAVGSAGRGPVDSAVGRSSSFAWLLRWLGRATAPPAPARPLWLLAGRRRRRTMRLVLALLSQALLERGQRAMHVTQRRRARLLVGL